MNSKIIFILLFCFGFAGMTSAQSNEKDQKREAFFKEMKAKRVAFITEKVNLTAEEAEVFWPLCNELQEKKFELNKPLREERRALRSSKKAMTNADYEKLLDSNADIKIKEAQLDKEYLVKFKKILSAEKIYKYQRAEEDFMKQMFPPRDRDHKGGPRGEERGKK